MAIKAPLTENTETLEDIARRLRVSRRTVSRVLRQDKNVAPALRERVAETLSRANFVPNAPASRLAGGRVPVIGMVFPTGMLSGMDDYVTRFLKGALRAAHPASHQLTLLDFDRLDEHQAARLFRGRLVGSFIFAAFGSRDFPAMRRLRKAGVPVVALSMTCPGVDSVDCDNRQGGYIAANHLLQGGRRRLGFFHGDPSWLSSQERFEGFQKALAEAGQKVETRWVRSASYDRAAAQQAAEAMFTEGPGPDGIFAANDKMMLGIYQAARRRGIAVPKDVALVGFDDIPLCDMPILDLTFSSVAQPLDEMAFAAAERAIALAAGGERKPFHQLFSPVLRARQSSAGKTRRA